MKIVLTVPLCLLLGGCLLGELPDRYRRSWRNPAPAGKDIEFLSTPDYAGRAMAVKGVAVPEAINRLKTQAFVPISKTEAARYLNTRRALAGKGGYFLLRGVSFDDFGDFHVTQLRSKTQVYFHTMGSMKVRARNTPVVARLPRIPSEVYTEASIDE
jgi:hypothetical protein